jgi:hypothetical protein
MWGETHGIASLASVWKLLSPSQEGECQNWSIGITPLHGEHYVDSRCYKKRARQHSPCPGTVTHCGPFRGKHPCRAASRPPIGPRYTTPETLLPDA